MNERLRAWHAPRVFQGLAALAVAATGFASLGTSDCSTVFSLEAAREVVFAPDELSRLVRVRASPSTFESLTLTASGGAELVRVDPPGPDGIAGAGGAGGADAGGTGGSGSEVELPSGSSEHLLRIDRGPIDGALSVTVTARLGAYGSSCGEWGDPEMDLRIDVAD